MIPRQRTFEHDEFISGIISEITEHYQPLDQLEMHLFEKTAVEKSQGRMSRRGLNQTIKDRLRKQRKAAEPKISVKPKPAAPIKDAGAKPKPKAKKKSSGKAWQPVPGKPGKYTMNGKEGKWRKSKSGQHVFIPDGSDGPEDFEGAPDEFKKAVVPEKKSPKKKGKPSAPKSKAKPKPEPKAKPESKAEPKKAPKAAPKSKRGRDKIEVEVPAPKPGLKIKAKEKFAPLKVKTWTPAKKKAKAALAKAAKDPSPQNVKGVKDAAMALGRALKTSLKGATGKARDALTKQHTWFDDAAANIGGKLKGIFKKLLGKAASMVRTEAVEVDLYESFYDGFMEGFTEAYGSSGSSGDLVDIEPTTDYPYGPQQYWLTVRGKRTGTFTAREIKKMCGILSRQKLKEGRDWFVTDASHLDQAVAVFNNAIEVSREI